MNLMVEGRQRRAPAADSSVNAPSSTRQSVGPSWVCHGRLLPAGCTPSVRVNPGIVVLLDLEGPLLTTRRRFIGSRPSCIGRLRAYKAVRRLQDRSSGERYVFF